MTRSGVFNSNVCSLGQPRKNPASSSLEKTWRFYLPMVVFVFLDAIGLRMPSALRLAFACASYLFLFWVAAKDIERGVAYYILFSLLCVRSSLFETGATLMNFGDLRLGGITLNFIFGNALALWVYRTTSKSNLAPVLGQRLWLWLLGAGFINGLIMTFMGVNHLRYFFQDVFRYVPIVMYLILVPFLKKTTLEKLIVAYVVGTLFLTLCSWGLGIYRSYGFSLKAKFLLQNVGSRVFFPMLLLLGLQHRNCRWMLLASLFYGWLIFSGKTLLEGKEAVFIFVFLPFAMLSCFPRQKVLKLAAIGSIVFVLPLLILIVQWVQSEMSRNTGAYLAKLNYAVVLLSDFDLNAIVRNHDMGSLRNLIGEGLTLAANLSDNLYYFVFGKGFGGALHDVFHYLWVDAGHGGYSLEAASLDAYLTPHIAFYCLALKLGVIGLILEIGILCRLFLSRSPFAAIAFLVVFTYFVSTKESLLFGFILMRCAVLDDPSLLRGWQWNFHYGHEKTSVH